MKVISIIALSLALFSCKEDLPNAGENEIVVALEESVTKTISGKSWTVTLNSIDENSLCPDDVQCIWAGRIVVSIKVNNVESKLGAGDLSPKDDEMQIPNHLQFDQTKITIIDASEIEDDKQWIKLKFAIED